MRKQKNRDRRKTENPGTAKHSYAREDSVFSGLGIMIRLAHPKVPGGGNLYFTRQHLKPLLYRVPFATLLFLLVTSDTYFPYIVQGSIGPSMLPTIQYIGDLWLIETWAWRRLFGLQVDLSIGDVVIWNDPTTQRVSCKRIIGLGGDTVKRFGQYVHLYRDREDFGIAIPADVKSQKISSNWDFAQNTEGENIDRTISIPPGHVWMEGDCPPFSLDSRHYGFIPEGWIIGRLLYRVWPLVKTDENGKNIPSRVAQQRPIPFSSKYDYLGWRFNFHKVPKQSKGDTPPS